MNRIVVAPRAETQIQTICRWWQTNRGSQELFANELTNALELLMTMPGLGLEYATRRGVVIRRVLLPRSRYHVYFSHDEARQLVEVRAVWGATRGRAPAL